MCKDQISNKQVANYVTCDKKSPDHISNSLTFPGFNNSLAGEAGKY